MQCIRSYMFMIIVFFPTPQRYIPLRNDQNKIADILQECKGEYSVLSPGTGDRAERRQHHDKKKESLSALP